MEEAALRNDLCLLPLGIPTLVISDDPQLIAAVASAYAHWLAEAPVSEPRIELRLETADASPSEQVCLDIRVEGSRLMLGGLGAEGIADAATRKARARLSRKLVSEPASFVEVVDTLLLFMLARAGRTPVHASAFMAGDLAVLLAGPSGSGKSTLAHAAAARGLPVLSDDMVFVQREPSFAVWGYPRPIHLLPADAPAGDHPTRIRNGKLKAAVPLRLVETCSTRAALVVLDRGEKAQLRPIASNEAIDALMNLDAGFDLLATETRAVAGDLAQRGAWRLTLSSDPDEAIDLVVKRFGGR